MRISVSTAQWFSEALLRIYAARDVIAVKQALISAEAGLVQDGNTRWLLDLLDEHVEHRLQQLRDEPASMPPAIVGLTPREQEVLQCIAAGKTDAQIGADLGISPKTASKHVENILHKLGVETRTGAVAALFPRRS